MSGVAQDGRLYNVFRVLVIPVAQQQHALQFEEKTKEQALREVFDDLSSRTFTNLSSKYKLYGTPRAKDDEETIYKYQLGKAGKKTLHKEEGGRPIAYKAADIKLVDIIYSWERQILLIKKSHLFDEWDIVRVMRHYLQHQLRYKSVVVNIEAMPTITDFWRIMNNTNEVFELSIEVNQLNINEGDANFREVLKNIKTASNDDSLVLKLRNKLGYLSINNPTIKGIIHYISEVGGKFKATYKEIGTTRRATYNSDDNVKQVKIEKSLENVKDKDVQTRIDKLNED